MKLRIEIVFNMLIKKSSRHNPPKVTKASKLPKNSKIELVY